MKIVNYEARVPSYACYRVGRGLPAFVARLKTRAGADIFARLFLLKVCEESLIVSTTKCLALSLADALKQYLADLS